MPLYEITWWQDCGYAATAPVGIIQARDDNDARKNYVEIVQSYGIMCNAYGDDDLLKLVRLSGDGYVGMVIKDWFGKVIDNG